MTGKQVDTHNAVGIELENLEGRAYARLRVLILTRVLGPGERIQPDQLAAKLGVSRTPILNALKRLAHEQVVEWVSRRGIYVKRYTKREMARLFEVREMLECLSARLAAARISEEEINRLAQMFDAVDDRPGLPIDYIEKDSLFHSRLIEVANNPFLTHAVNAVSVTVFAFQQGLRPIRETNREHQAILAALRDRNPDAAEAAMRLHIGQSIRCLDAQADAEEEEKAKNFRPLSLL